MGVSDVFFQTTARSILTGFFSDPQIMDMVTMHTDLQRFPGSSSVQIPVWNHFTVQRAGASTYTPCGSNRPCEEPQATMVTVTMTPTYVAVPYGLEDLDIMTDDQKAGMVEQILQDMMADFECGPAYYSVFDVLFTDAVFNGPAAGNPPIILTDTAASYRQLSTAISRARSKTRAGDTTVFLAPNPLAGFCDSIPDRPIERLLNENRGVNYHVVGNSDLFSRSYGGTTYTGRIGFLYPKDAIAYAAPKIGAPSRAMAGAYGNISTTMLDDVNIPGESMFVRHHYGLKVVREGDVTMVIAPV